VLDDAMRPRSLLHRDAPSVNRATGETLLTWRVDRHALEPKHRHPVMWYDIYAEAVAYCKHEIEAPQLTTPLRDGYGPAVPANVQRARYAARTGAPVGS
jgi:hypothetical protein